MESTSLAQVVVGNRVRITSVRLDQEATAWLAAVGLHEGEELVVLRRAVFGGPLHVRTASGGEFAVARELADYIGIAPVHAVENAKEDPVTPALISMERT